GFTPLVIRRIASVSALRRTLSDVPATPAPASRSRLMRPRVRRLT
ncbi:MAG: hypothetical protein H0T85_08960, partial [Geodermatophilaceae bacterium]|nr:hypothetical protein [Geodermatophilaceae bacterium]